MDSLFRADRQSAIQHWEAQEKQDVVISVRFHFAFNETCLVNAETITICANPKAEHEVNAGSFFFILSLCFAIWYWKGWQTCNFGESNEQGQDPALNYRWMYMPFVVDSKQ